MSVAWPPSPDIHGWWMSTRELGSEKRLPLVAGGQQHRGDRRRLADARGLHVGTDELHGVVDGEAGGDRAARAVDVEQDVLVGILGLEEQHLGDGQVGHVSSIGVPMKMMLSFSSREKMS